MDETAGSRTRLVVGLGNPGARYEGTRHNVGYLVVEELAGRRSARFGRSECNSLLAAAGDDLLLAKPLTYMNRSGYAARCLLERRDLDASSILVVYDDVWLPLGRLRARPRGGPGGHRGMESIVNSLRTPEIGRLRLGVGWEGGPPEGVDLVEYVLEPFAEEDRGAVEALVGRAADACECWLDHGMEETMARYNGLAEPIDRG
ncbi:MAG: aminoacyl-tRNA hydrolase [Thermoanaerobaculia bacterium]|nr:aminoacyl-tRNA hydrolase [Thermoanaerobaculia bacterium]